MFRSQHQFGMIGKITLALEPIEHGSLELIERNFGANLHHPIPNRQRVVEDTGICEIPHGKIIQPLHGTLGQLPIQPVLHRNVPRIHAAVSLPFWNFAAPLRCKVYINGSILFFRLGLFFHTNLAGKTAPFQVQADLYC